MSASDYKICPICKKRVENVFDAEKEKDNLSYKELKVLEMIKDGYNWKYDDLKEIKELIEDVNLHKIQDKCNKRILPANGVFQTVRVDWEYSLKEDKLWMRFMARCDTCETEWELDNEWKNNREKKAVE